MDVCLTCHCRFINYTALSILIMQLKRNSIGDEIKRKQSKRRYNVPRTSEQQTFTSSSLIFLPFGTLVSLFRLNSSLARSWTLLFWLSIGSFAKDFDVQANFRVVVNANHMAVPSKTLSQFLHDACNCKMRCMR